MNAVFQEVLFTSLIQQVQQGLHKTFFPDLRQGWVLGCKLKLRGQLALLPFSVGFPLS